MRFFVADSLPAAAPPQFPWRVSQDCCGGANGRARCLFFENPTQATAGQGTCLRYPATVRKSATAWCGEWKPETPPAAPEGGAA